MFNKSILEECIPLPLDIPEEELMQLVAKAKDWAIMHGVAMRSKKSYSPNALNFAPFLLTPSSFPRKAFEKAVELQTVINRLMHSVAYDEEFLTTTLAETIKVDDFTANLFNIYKKVLANGFAQAHSLGILRSDYMAHRIFADLAILDIKQVEINTIASSFAGISLHLLPLQSFILRELNQQEKLKNMPKNHALSGICDGMIKAWIVYNNPKAVIVFIIEDISYNICDQRFHEFYIREKCPEIKILRYTLTDVYKFGKLGPNKELLIGSNEVGVVYFRAGYEPGHYHCQGEWDARYLIECSLAIKCPSIQYHLAGTKKVQQALAVPGVLERFINDSDEIVAVSKIFTGLYSLEDNECGNAAYEMALKEPERFVLKPQREGGGNNIYSAEIPDALKKMSRSERAAWILMDLIQPPVTKGYIIRPENEGTVPKVVDVVSELGIFGVILGDADNIIANYQSGHMLRTKLSTSNEGGVASGLGALDSPYLVD